MEKQADRQSRQPLDGKRIVLDNWELINRLARKRFGDGPLAEEAALIVTDRLLADDGARLKGYAGRGPLRAFLAALSWRLLEDFARSRYGRRRPPLWIRHLGGVWEKLYILLCLERLDIMEAVAMVSRPAAGVRPLDAEDAAWNIRQQVVDCGARQGLEVELTDESVVEKVTPNPGEQIERFEIREKRELFARLFAVLTDLPEAVSGRGADRLSSLAIELSAPERLLLQLHYRDELPLSRVGEMLGLNRFQVHGRLRRLLKRLRRELEDAGLDRDVLELLR